MFEGEDWNVDSKATSLDSSLFGPVTPKSKKRKSKSDDQHNKEKEKVALKRKAFNEGDSGGKNGKKSKNKKGLADKSNIPSNDGLTDQHSKIGQKGKQTDLNKNKQKGREKQKSLKRKETSGEQENKVEKTSDGGNIKQIPGNENRNRKKKSDTSESSSDKTDTVKDKVEKRELGEEKKLSIADKKRRKRKKEKERKKRKMLNTSENSSPKKAKLDESSFAGKKETGQLSRKERRNKRKKNNSKKNKFANLSLGKNDVSGNLAKQNAVVTNTKKAAVKQLTEHDEDKSTTKASPGKLNENSKGTASSKKKKRKGKAKVDPSNDSTKKSPNEGSKSKVKFTKLQSKDSTETPGKQKFDLTKLKEVLSTSEKKIKVITDELEVRSKKHQEPSEEDLKEDNMAETKKSKKDKRTNTKNTPDKNKSAKKGGMENQGQEKSLKERMQAQLNAARFRYLNEQLYTTTGAEAAELFAEDDDAFHVYHQGYQTQVSKWPVDPLSIIIKQIKARHKSSKTVIADLGCGSARLAESLPGFKVHSFDFVAANERVTACDMSHVPLKDGSVDVVVFCLSLMGTNLVEYILEANRILKSRGTMKVAEVESRFKKVGAFVSKVEKLGFEVVIKDLTNKMFYLFDFKKDGDVKSSASNPKIELDPCIYKKR